MPIWLPEHVLETLPPNYVDDLLERIANAGGVQAEILADGTVTMGDMERAALAVLACVEDEGVKVAEFAYEDGLLEITYAYDGVPAHPVAREDEVYEQCLEDNYHLISEVRGLQRTPTEQQRQIALEGIRACMRDLGIEDDFNEDFEHIGSDPASVSLLGECMRAADRALMWTDD